MLLFVELKQYNTIIHFVSIQIKMYDLDSKYQSVQSSQYSNWVKSEEQIQTDINKQQQIYILESKKKHTLQASHVLAP